MKKLKRGLRGGVGDTEKVDAMLCSLPTVVQRERALSTINLIVGGLGAGMKLRTG